MVSGQSQSALRGFQTAPIIHVTVSSSSRITISVKSEERR